MERKTKMVLITPMQAAEQLGLTRDGLLKDPERSVRRMVRRGDLRGLKVAGRQMVDQGSVDEYLSVASR